ncbi:MAG TPA: hypothetical protein VJT09_04620 [Pyrinomonadaceae bacterium]|nr:hypothetical protein [Pyrinomonadaceae bacterium]
MKKTTLKLVDPKDETAELNARFDELLAKTNRNQPSEKDVKAFRRLLRDHPEQKLWQRIAGIIGHAESYALDSGPLSPGLNEVLRHKQNEIRERLGYDEASEMEQLLISHATLCWLRLGLAEIRFTKVMSGNNSFKLCEFYERHLSLAQRRFTRACETLERVRLLARSNPGLRLTGQKVA